MTTPRLPAARTLARQLIERDAGGLAAPAELADAMERTCTRIAEDLRRSVGDDGYAALLTRALARARSTEPALKDICRIEQSVIRFDIAGGIAVHGVVAVGGALASLIAALVDILSDLIGEDMTRSLLRIDAPANAARRTAS